jgi:hypothetical protein
MHRDRSGSTSHGRHAHQSQGSERSSHHTREHGRRHHRDRESRREKSDPYHVNPSGNSSEAQPVTEASGSRSGGGRRGGGFEMGVVSRSQEESSPWLTAAQTTPTSPPSYMSTLGLAPPAAVTRAENGK